MKGNPKYKVGDTVELSIDGKIVKGVIYVIDPDGTFEDDSDVSYDVLTYSANGSPECLYKHITESFIKG